MAHTSYQDLAKRVQGAEAKVIVGGIYHHYRDSGQRYRVIGVGLDEATEELVVVYEMLVTPRPVIWTRKLRGPDGWLTPVAQNGLEVPRFQFVND